MTESIETLIIGAGQAGLSLSYYLTQQHRAHFVLEQAAQVAEAWRNHRWDSFTLNTPNWQTCLPGYEYQGDDTDGFMPRDEIVAYFEGYAASFNPPIRFGVHAEAVDQAGSKFRVQTNQGDYQADNVVIATGLFQRPRIPAFSSRLSPRLTQLHSSEYRSPAQLPPGAVLVVGSAQSGCQIAEELYQSGRKIYLSVGKGSGRAPRRYRGKDTLWWLTQTGFFDRMVDKLPSPQAKFAANPQISGNAGGHTINLHQFSRDGVILLGRVIDAHAERVAFAPDLMESLAAIDKFEVDLVKNIDDFIARNGIKAPEENLPHLTDGYASLAPIELDLSAARISTVIWAMGYQHDFSWVHLPVLDADGFPIQQFGVTAFPGLYFLGLPWLYKLKSGLLFGVGEHAAYIASQIRSS